MWGIYHNKFPRFIGPQRPFNVIGLSTPLKLEYQFRKHELDTSMIFFPVQNYLRLCLFTNNLSYLNHNIKLKVKKYYWLCNIVMDLFCIIGRQKEDCLTDIHAIALEWMYSLWLLIFIQINTEIQICVSIYVNISWLCPLGNPRSNDTSPKTLASNPLSNKRN